VYRRFWAISHLLPDPNGHRIHIQKLNLRAAVFPEAVDAGPGHEVSLTGLEQIGPGHMLTAGALSTFLTSCTFCATI
jgi:hypothetical protein